jgi:hypothetical protein
MAVVTMLVALATVLPMSVAHAEEPATPAKPNSSIQPPPAAAAESESAERIEAVIAAARAYLGTAYRIGSEGPDFIDCSGLVFRAFSNAAELGQVGGARLRAVQYLRWFAARDLVTTNVEEIERGDLVIYDSGSHIGIYLGEGRVISAVVTGVTVHALDGISVKPTGFLAVDWSGKRGPFKPGNPVLPTILDQPEAPAALVPAIPWTAEAPADEIAYGPTVDGEERTDMRTLNSRTFEDVDGTFTTEIFARPIHYLPADSTEWQPIDLRFHALDDESGAAVADTSPITVGLRGADADGALLSLGAGELAIGLTPDRRSGDASAPELGDEGRYADYRDVLGEGIGLRVFPRADGLKAFLVLAEEPDTNRFTFAVEAPGLIFVEELDGSITLRDAEDAVVGRIPRPMLLDSSDIEGDGGGVRGSAVSLRLDQPEVGRADLTMAVDRASLDEAVYPAFVDLGMVDFPTSASSAAHTFASSAQPNANFSTYQRPEAPGYAELWHGRRPERRDDNAAYLRFAGLTDLLSGVVVESASLAAFPYWQAEEEAASSTWMSRVAEDWDVRTLTWNTRPAADPELTTFETTQGNWSAMDVSTYVQSVTSGASADYGLVLHADEQGRGYWKRFVVESAMGSGMLEPRLVVNWSGLRPLPATASVTTEATQTLAWSNAVIAADATRYQVQVSDDGFNSVLSSARIKGAAVTENAWTVARDEFGLGTFDWRVRARYGDSTEWSAWSEPASFSFVNPVVDQFHLLVGDLTGGT